MNAKNYTKTINRQIAVALLMLGQQTAFAVVNDSVAAT